MRFHRIFLIPFAAALAAAPVFAANTGPTISAVSYPSNVAANVPATLSATVTSSKTVTSCNLYVDSDDKGAMTLSTGKASKVHTFPRGGVFTVFVFCRDSAGGFSSGTLTSIYVGGATVEQPTYGGSEPPASSPVPEAPEAPVPSASGVVAGSLIKLACSEPAAADDPCRAVYYYGADGKRHAFPNEKTYFSWYADFDAVTTVDAATLGGIPFGKNVTYRPGLKMVKFQTLNNVYAVGKGGVLRWVTSEAVARALYGDDWNRKIDDIADTFYTNYTFGADIVNPDDYAAASEMNAVRTIGEN